VVIESDSEKVGLKSAVAELHNPADPVPGSENAEQMALLPGLPLDSVQESHGVRTGPGRPPGAKNKNTEAWRKFLLSKHRSPLEVLAQTYGMSVEMLAKRLGATDEEVNKLTLSQRLEIFRVMIQAAKELAPYLHQKMPQAIEAGEGGLIQLVINQGAGGQHMGDQAGPIAFQVLNHEDEENQLVSDLDFHESSQSRHNDTEANGGDNE